MVCPLFVSCLCKLIDYVSLDFFVNIICHKNGSAAGAKRVDLIIWAI